jgi:hypothetical protein
MKMATVKWCMITSLILVAVSGLAGCGGDDDACAGVECDVGVCQEGVCSNPSSCESDLQCIPGYDCEDATCKAASLCDSDGDCEAGVCRGGRCQNPSTCARDANCLERTYCNEDGKCVDDPCNHHSCERGVCERGTTECRSKETCSPDTEGQDCIAGEQCHNGQCVAPEEFCEELACERGVCDFEGRECTNADDCDGDDSRCLDGYLCGEDGECFEDLCVGVSCPDGGVCQPSVGQCENAAPCFESSDCLEGHWCVEGECRLESLACGEHGCPGHQICEYDAASTTASCHEDPDTACTTSFDCLGERQCGGLECLEPTSCSADRFEPNDAADQATPVQVSGGGLVAEATLCAGDVDFYAFDLDDLQHLPLRGKMRVSVVYAQRDVGLGELEMEVYDPDGDLVGSDSSGPLGESGRMDVVVDSFASTPRNYTVRVVDAGDVASPGIHYTVSADLVDVDSHDACEDATRLSSVRTTSGDTSNSTAAGFGSSCTATKNPSPADVYTFEVGQSSRVTLEFVPDDDSADFALSLRSDCLRLESEVACADVNDQGDEVLSKVVGPGTYWVVVQGASDADPSGPYQLSLDVTQTQCSGSDSACLSHDEAQVCTPNGAQLENRSCALGCRPHTGTCVRREGDLCGEPIEVGDGVDEPIVWSNFTNDYALSSGSCLDGGGPSLTSGPEAVYAVELQPNHGMVAELALPGNERGSLYLLSECVSPGSSCLAGGEHQDDNVERLTYYNDTGRPRRLMLVADSAAATNPTSANLSVEIGERICEPDALRCDAADDVEQCGEVGIEYKPEESCDFGCNDGECAPPPNQDCSGAIALTSGQPHSQRLNYYENSFSYDQVAHGCVGNAADGPDAVYTITTGQPDQVVDVEVDAPWDVSLTAARHCYVDQMQCLAGADSPANPQTLSFTAREAGDYYLIVDTVDTNASGTFSITATVQTPACTPGTVDGCSGSSLTYCDRDGTAQSYACDGSCSAGACDAPTGDVCADAVELGDGDSITDSLAGTNSVELPGRNFGGCLLDSGDATIGAENIYRVDLSDGDLLEAELSGQDDTFLFLVEDCFFAAQTCLTNQPSGDSASLSYHSDADRSVYLIVDSNSASSASQYTLSVDVSQGSVCAPDQSRCAGPNTIEKCNGDGSAILNTYSCAGQCVGGRCLPDLDSADACSSAPNIGDGIGVWGRWGALSNDVEIGSGRCTQSPGWGGDLVYEVSLAADEVVVARAQSADAFEVPMIYIVTSCTDPNNTCQSGATGASGVGEVEARYQAAAAETVYVVVDSASDVYTEHFALTIDKVPAECSASTADVCYDSQTLEYCDDGLFERKPCYYGSGCVSGACEAPTHDTCGGAIDVPVDGNTHTYRGFFEDFSDQYDVGGASCMPNAFDTSAGPDAVFSVYAQADDLISATWLGSSDPSLWITSDCQSAANSCVAGDRATSQTPVSVSYVAPADGYYYIIGDVDEDGSTVMDEFEMDISVTPPECLSGVDEPTCVDGNTLEYCGEFNHWISYSCAGGCSNGQCGAPTGDFCGDPIALSDGESDTQTYSGTNDSDPVANNQTGSCNFSSWDYTGGVDHFYAVDLQDGETLTASYTGGPTGGSCCGIMYILTDCWDTNTCQSTTGEASSGSLNYTASADETVYVIMDRTISGSTSSYDYTLDVSVSP